jgi:GH15 family glucan-1,4-alpha-glucosidase
MQARPSFHIDQYDFHACGTDFVHSKVMAWVAFDRAANELEARAFNESGRRLREIADEIHAEVSPSAPLARRPLEEVAYANEWGAAWRGC